MSVQQVPTTPLTSLKSNPGSDMHALPGDGIHDTHDLHDGFGMHDGHDSHDAEAALPATPTASGVGDRFVLKSGDTFIVNDVVGNIGSDEHGQDGLFVHDTRVLSRLQLTLGGRAPSLLSGNVDDANTVFTAHLIDRALPGLGEDSLEEGAVHLKRMRVLTADGIDEAITLTHYGQAPATVTMSIAFGADFRDMFEVRGSPRPRRGEIESPMLDDGVVVLAYVGLDQVERTVHLSFSPAPMHLAADHADYRVTLEPGSCTTVYLSVALEERPVSGERRLTPVRRALASRTGMRDALLSARQVMRTRAHQSASLRSNNSLFNAWLSRSKADLNLLTTDLPTGPYPYAGIPWFSTPFGRDGIITAMQMLWIQPALAKGVLRFLATHQAERDSAFQDAQPGKIMHETRRSEMAATGEVPFGMYYGGVDTTPLFVVLAGEYHTRTGDDAFIEELWPALTRATAWVSNVCDASPLGLLAYQRGEESGLANQGWKDSADSVFHADGSFPEGPIALIEVQAYACVAFETMARLANRRAGKAHPIHPDRPADPEDADADTAAYATRATKLRERIEASFWMEDQQFYGIAVDGKGNLCRVRASNAGHLLAFGLPAKARGDAVISRLRSSEFANGWGIRTLASGQARYNPMSYHNGSVWPHDTALCAKGIARYGDKAMAVGLLKRLHEAAVGFNMRLPELFCGFTRPRGEPPTAYPVACLPQAWATGAPFMLLEACLGVSIDAVKGEVIIDRPDLPPGVDFMQISDLWVGDVNLTLTFSRVDGHVVPSSSPSPLKVVALL